MALRPDDQTEELLEKFSLDKLRFRTIEVISSGILYRGILIGADDSDLYLKGRLRYLILPLEKITSLRLEGEQECFDRLKIVDAEFYSDFPPRK